MGGSEQGPDDGPTVSYSAVHRLEMELHFPVGGGIPAETMTAAQAAMVRELEAYGVRAGPEVVSIELRKPGVAALVGVVGTTRTVVAPAGFPPLLEDMTPGQRMDRAGGLGGDGAGPGAARVARPADGMDLGEGFGRAGAG